MEIKILHQVMDWNEDVSEEVKDSLASHQICMINIMEVREQERPA